MKARFAITLLALLALVLGGTGPAAAQNRSETFPVFGCLIDGEGELRQADLARLPANAQEAIITGAEVPNTTADIKCTRSNTRENAQLTCTAFLPGRVSTNLNINTFLNPCLIDFEPCTGVRRDIVEAATNTLKAKNENANACLEQFPNGGDCFSLTLDCKVNRNH